MSAPSLYTGTSYLPPVEAKPTELRIEPVAPPPGAGNPDDEFWQHVAEILLAGYALAKAAELLAKLLSLHFGITIGARAAKAALGLAGESAHQARAQFKAHGFNRGDTGYGVMRGAADGEIHYRAAYVSNAARRIQSRMDDGMSFRQALAAEQRHYDAHKRARRNRIAAAAAVGKAARDHGNLLGWYRDVQLDSDAECIAADGANFYATHPPLIGWPGAVHEHCGCTAGPPHATARMVDEDVAHLVARESAVRLVRRRAS